MSKNKDNVSLKEVFELNLRALKLLAKTKPGYYPLLLANKFIDGVSPYVTVFFSARLITELTTARRPEQLLFWALGALLSEFILRNIGSAIWHWRSVKREHSWYRKNKIFLDKGHSMDYVDIESQETRDLIDKIHQSENWSGRGLNAVEWQFEQFYTNIIGVLSAIALTVGFFTAKVPEGSAGAAFFGNPLSVIGLIAFLILSVWVSPLLGELSNKLHYGAADQARLGNRAFSHYGFMSREEYRALDMRIYNQQRIATVACERCDVFAPGGIFAKLNAGKMGLLNVLDVAVDELATIAVYFFVCLKAWAGAFGIGQVTQYIGALSNFINNITGLMWAIRDMRVNAEFLKDTYKFLDIPNKMYQGSLTTEKRSDRQYEIEFRDVSFKYPNTERWALRHVNVKFKIGSRLAVVGENGSGKTTFIKLLCRLYDPQEGQIFLNGIDIKKYNYQDYVNVFSVVFQDFSLLSLPLGQNVSGKTEYDRELATKCLNDAGFGDRLKELPDGLDTYLYKEFDDSGVQISGGEAQKIAIARALYKDAPFIVLDEPTAALDPIAEAEIYSQFDEITGDKTAIYISHRLSSCRFCDEILVFSDGGIAQKGRHDDLIESDGLYKELWFAQAQYYDEEQAAKLGINE